MVPARGAVRLPPYLFDYQCLLDSRPTRVKGSTVKEVQFRGEDYLRGRWRSTRPAAVLGKKGGDSGKGWSILKGV